ncbi:response regulator [Belliella aquatica]|uniref:DNA-binding response regulator n=1 Tax=Belliella aquatica TaxID=1323734 RepID=A0ABQ1LTH4_9BACT|nr:response regulator transcription factor [Belliella aquatica]MCH7407234.1 response regulator transcription factor [Belliella aquatica]GGC29556.1 DNA-binding response regulator [Belliella aquatica]
MQIAIVDDNNFLITSVREKLSFFDDFTIGFTATNGKECLDKLQTFRNTDLILMDIEMPLLNGIETTALVKNRYPQIKIIILTVFDDDEKIFNAIKAGADGYLLKETAPQELHNAIKQTLDGGAAMTPSIALKTLNLLRTPIKKVVQPDIESSVQLSKREVEVLEQLSTGIPYTLIAENLFISPYTVRRHIENIYQKLKVHSKIEAIEEAKKKRLI